MALSSSFSKLSEHLVSVFETREKELNDEKITVNDLVSKVAYFYEKFRTAMDYGTEETILRRAIERIIKRMLFLKQSPKNVAENLVRELIWAGYFPNATVSQSLIDRVSSSIALYLELKEKVLSRRILKNEDIDEFIMDILSCEISSILILNKEREAVINFTYQILKNSIDIQDDSEQTKNIQVFIAIRKAFAKDDTEFLKYVLFTQIFGKLRQESIENILNSFEEGYKEIKYQLAYPLKEKILSAIKRKIPSFLILYDILAEEKGRIRTLAPSVEAFREKVFATCSLKYKSIGKKVKTAIIRSFIFILFTKATIALAIEGTYESVFLGEIQWSSMVLNTILPPSIMVIVGLSIKTPNEQNSEIIYEDIQKLLFEENPAVVLPVTLRVKSNNAGTLKDFVFSILWILSIFLTLGIIWILLDKLQFNDLSKVIFIFFIAIISFLSYRIYQTADSYRVLKKPNLFTPLFDFFFVPIIRVGQRLTEGVAQINFILIAIDFIIEAPFKSMIGFFEQWFLFVANKREQLE